MSYCDWAKSDKILVEYHDNEWGVPVFDDARQFEYLMLEVMQCGLSWLTVLKKRDVFRACFDGFDFERVAEYNENDLVRIMHTEGMIRSEGKIRAVINNAQKFTDIRREFGSFSEYLWGYTDGKSIIYDGHADGFIPNSNGLSDDISKDLRRRGFKYIGSVTVYSHLQACGMINDHAKSCMRYTYVNDNFETVRKLPYNEHNVVKY
jgi:DNA-3-methyladenine glycosylase I